MNNLSEKQLQFLKLHIMDQVPMAELPALIGEERKILSAWYEELKPYREEIAGVRAIFVRKKINTIEFSEFYSIYINLPRFCTYCQITEEEIDKLIQSGELKTKRLVTRGRKLELDRMQPELDYNVINNLHLCCYWCNNAKTDTFSHAEFIEIGKAIRRV